MRPIWLIGLIFPLLAACASSEHADDPNYKLGYTDGCGSGTAYVPGESSTLRRETELYATDKAYRAGWNSGYRACRVSTASETPGGNYQTRKRTGVSGL